MSSGFYFLLYNDVLVVDGKLTFRFATFYRCDSLLLWKDIRHPLVYFINLLGRSGPVGAYT